MKRLVATVFFIFLALSISANAQYKLPSFPPGNGPGLILWCPTDKYEYENDETFLMAATLKNLSGTENELCLFRLVGKTNDSQLYLSISQHIKNAGGGQINFSFIEKDPGIYKFKAFFYTQNETAVSNEVEIIITTHSGSPHKISDVKYESCGDGKNIVIWWKRIFGDYNDDGTPEWSQPFRCDPPPEMAPRKTGKTISLWGSIKSGGVR